jgi:hypothetical protein
LVLPLLWLLSQSPVTAEPSPPPAPTVEVCARVRSEIGALEGLRDAVEAQVADVDVPVDFEGTQRRCEREVSFGLRRDPSGAEVELFIEDSTRPDERIVRTLGEAEMDAGARDEMFALIVRRSLAAAVAGHSIEVERARIEARSVEAVEPEPELPEPAETCPDQCLIEPPPPAPVARGRRNWFRFGASYHGRSWSDEATWQHGLSLSAGWEHISGVELAVFGSLFEPQEYEDQVIYLRVSSTAIGARVGYRYGWDRGSVGVQSGLALDSYTNKALSRATGLLVQDSARRWLPGLYLGADGDLRVYGPLSVNLGVGASWMPSAFDFTIEEAGVSRTLVGLQSLRFELQMGLRVQI